MIIHKNELSHLHDELQDASIALRFGTYDLLHSGHQASIEQAAAQADILVVGVMPDEYVTRIKGPNRPISPEQLRLQRIDDTKDVDYSFIAPSKALGLAKAIFSLRPEVYIEDEEQHHFSRLKTIFLGAIGTEHVIAPRNDGGSTTEMINLLGLDEAVARAGFDFALPRVGQTQACLDNIR
jgi:cytidyltransferase-like protein